MLYSPQDERKLVMLENSLNFRFKKIGTPGAKEIAEASAEIATKKWDFLFWLGEPNPKPNPSLSLNPNP